MAKLGYDTPEQVQKLRKRQQAVLDDFRVIDMYDAAIRHDLQVYRDRTGNWVQKFTSDQDAALFATAQFSRYTEVEQFLREQFSDASSVRREAGGRSQS